MRLSLSQLNKAEVLRYLGWKGDTLPAHMDELIDRCMKQTVEIAAPQYIYRRFAVSKNDKGIVLGDDELLLAGDDIAAHLKGCEYAYILCVTVGIGIDKELRSKMVNSPDIAVIMDACATTAVEQVADMAEQIIRDECAKENNDVTWRFSPGYGDLPLETQKDLLKIMDTSRKIGLTVTDSFLMVPTKSVSAVLGVLPYGQAQPKVCDCSTCTKENCDFRVEIR